MKKLMMVGCLSLFIAGCGTLLYPERKGQTGGRLDPAVVALNGAGLILYLVPGLIAFAVDFHNGTIYLPAGQGFTDVDEDAEPISVTLPVTDEKIEAALETHYGYVFDLTNPGVETLALESLDELNQKVDIARLTW